MRGEGRNDGMKQELKNEGIKKMSRKLRNILLVSAIIPASYLCFFCLYCLYAIIATDIHDYEDFVFIIALLFGITGYVGLWTSIIIPQSIKLNIVLLCLGLCAFIFYIFYMEEGRLSFIKENLFYMLIPVVAIIILTDNFIRIAKHNRSFE